MPYVQRGTGMFDKSRILISGYPNTGKTQSLLTFIYGPYSPNDPEQAADALAYAEERQRRMVIIQCPGETGYRTLPEPTEWLQSFYMETAEGEDRSTLEWSRHALASFGALYKQVERSKPDVLAIDGLSALSEHIFNDVSDGAYLTGIDLSIDPASGKMNEHRGGKVYGFHHTAFGNWLSMFHASPVKMLLATCWEYWEPAKNETQRPGKISDTRYLWPALPGRMAKDIVGKFDARISTRMEPLCMHPSCELSKADEGRGIEHHCWQIMNKNDIMGIGIKGLSLTPEMVRRPWIHQTAKALESLLARRR